MPTLTLKFKDKISGEYPLDKGRSITIGRHADNDIVIENLAVSGRHAKIDCLEEGFLLTDLNSTNGSFVNEVLVTSHFLKHGDVITIGKHNLAFAYAEGEPQPPEPASAMDQTMIMDTEKHRAMLSKNIPKSAARPAGKAPAEQAVKEAGASGVLSILSGGEGEVILSKKITKIGKSPTSDIVVGGITMGKTAATISQRPNGYYLSYVQGMSKPKVNGETVKETVMLKEFDMIEIGSLKAQFVLKK